MNDLERLEKIIDRIEVVVEEDADDKEWVLEKFEQQQQEIERLTRIIEENSLPLHPCGVCGKEERNPGLDVCGECYHKQIWGNN